MSEQTFDDPHEKAATRFLDRAVDWAFGYDFFISYSHDDGLNFPRVLAERLTDAGFRVFLDQSGYVAGVELIGETRRQVSNSRKLVIVGRPCAMTSEWVLREAEQALERGKVPVIIDVNEAVENAPDDAKLAQMAKDSHWLRLSVSTDQPDGDPSEHVVSELMRGFGHTRQNQKRQRTFLGAAVVLASTTIMATALAFETGRQRDLAQANFEAAKETADDLVVEIARGLRNVEGLQTESIRIILTRAEETFDGLAQSVGENDELLMSLAAMQNEFVETYLALGDTEAAQKAAKKSVELTSQLRAQGKAVDEVESQVALSFVKHGDTMQETGEYELALQSYNRALAVRRNLARQNPKSDKAARDVAIVLARLAEVAEHRRDYDQMSALMTESLLIRKPLAKRNPDWQRDLVVANIMLGDALMGLRQTEKAKAAFDEAVHVSHTLHEQDTTSTRAARHYAIALQRRGNFALATSDARQAREDYSASKEVFEKLSRLDPDHIEWKRDVGVSMGKLAAAAIALNNKRLARELLSDTVAYRRDVLSLSPQNTLFIQDLAEALKEQGLNMEAGTNTVVLEEARDLLTQLGNLNPLTDEQQNWLLAIEDALNQP